MAKSLPLPLPLLLLGAVLLVAATLPAAWRVDAEWTPANPHGLVTQQVARFALIVHSLGHHKDLKYVGVVRGETEPAAGGGIIYHLVVVGATKTPDGNSSSRAEYDCLVWGVPGGSLSPWNLRRFRKIQS